MSFDQILRGDAAIVTGAGRNIGKAMAETFAEEGAQVAVADIDEERARSTVAEITESGGEAIATVVDVTDEVDVKAMVERVEDEFGGVDILVNNVAMTERTDFLELPVETFDQVLDVNLRGTFLCTREAAKSMKESGGGRIVNVASTSAHAGRPDAIAYATSKSGILNFTRSAAKALAEYDIRVNTLSPTRTGSRVGDEGSRSGEVHDDILVNRWGTPEDQANAALFLVSPESGFVNGTELLVDGGSSASGVM
ncbi:MAG: SDR family NAD(P)-dependent oxidoreductase [Halobacteriota archaeon]